MGGLFSEEKEDEVIDDVHVVRRRKDDFVYTKDPIFVTANYNSSVKRMFVTPKHENSSELQNYGILPDLVITKISLFLPLKEVTNFFITSKLFYHCSNSNLCWRERYQSVFDKSEKNSNSISSSSPEINWKKFYFIRHRKFTNDYFTKMYRTKNYESSKKTNLKCCFLGAGGVGKTSFVHRINRGVWEAHIEATIGASFLCLNYCRNSDNTTVGLELWDTAGQERYRSLHHMFYRGADIIFLCFALNDRESFYEDSWSGFRHYMKGIREICIEGKRKDDRPLIILLGMKSDLIAPKLPFFKEGEEVEDEKYGREVPEEDAMEFVRQNREMINGYVECSSKTGENVYSALGLILDLSIKRIKYLHFPEEERVEQYDLNFVK